MPTSGQFAIRTTTRSPAATPSFASPDDARQARSNSSPDRYTRPSKTRLSWSPSRWNAASAKPARLWSTCGGAISALPALRGYPMVTKIPSEGEDVPGAGADRFVVPVAGHPLLRLPDRQLEPAGRQLGRARRQPAQPVQLGP